MSRADQIACNLACIAHDLDLHRWARAWFHLAGLVRAFLPQN